MKAKLQFDKEPSLLIKNPLHPKCDWKPAATVNTGRSAPPQLLLPVESISTGRSSQRPPDLIQNIARGTTDPGY